MQGEESVRRILVFHAGALGDLVNTLPAIRALQSRFAGAEITAIGNLSLLVLFKSAGIVKEAISLESAGFHTLFRDSELSPRVRDLILSQDLVVSWIRSPQLIEQVMNLGVDCLSLKDRFPPPPGSCHVSEYMARALAPLGINPVLPSPRLSLPAEVVKEGPRFPGILVHPGSGSRHKNWLPQRFAEAALSLSRSTGLKIGVLEGPADREAAAEVIRSLGGSMSVHFSSLDTLKLAALVSGPALVLGNDSGVSHLAGALGTRVVAVFGPSDPGVWGVKQARAKNIAAAVECAPCPPEVMRQCLDRECMESIGVEDAVFSGLMLLVE